MSEAALAKDVRGILNTAGPEALRAAVMDAEPVEAPPEPRTNPEDAEKSTKSQTHSTSPPDADKLTFDPERVFYATESGSYLVDTGTHYRTYEVLTGKLPLDPLSKPALVAEARTAIEFIFPVAIGKIYRIEASTDLVIWGTVESGIVGAGGQVQRFYSILNVPKRYFRVEEDAP